MGIADDIAEFVSAETFQSSVGRIHMGGFPFADNPSRDSKDVIGRLVRMGGSVYRIKGIERHLPATPYHFGEPVGLLLEPAGEGA